MSTATDCFQLGPGLTLFPVIHGSGDCALEVRRLMLSRKFDCLAVPLPPSFQQLVEEALDELPQISVVLQQQPRQFFLSESDEHEDDTAVNAAYVPVDPCQPVIAALRIARQERMHRAFIEPETDDYLPRSTVLPDPYALKQVSAEQFAAAVLPAIPEPDATTRERLQYLAVRLHELSARHDSILCLCSLQDWPWLRQAYQQGPQQVDPPEWSETPAESFAVDPRTLIFCLGELPFITSLYELARAQLDDDENLSVDGIKALLIAARDSYVSEFGRRARRISPGLLARTLKYARNLSLIERRLTPDLYTLIVATRQTAGDQYAIHVAEQAAAWPWQGDDQQPQIRFGVDLAQLPDGTRVRPLSWLPGPPVVWRSCRLNARPDQRSVVRWQKTWNPYGQCSWPPEDTAIEQFRSHIRDVALDMMGHDLARTEKFSASMKDGLDIRETLRNWHTGDLYVRVNPPAAGRLDCVLMLFDSPADPRDYPWRITWHAEHQDESTLSLFATNFLEEMVGPGIAVARYGGAMFLFPPRPVPDIWQDSRFDFVDTLEERLLAAALHYSREKQIAVMSHAAPGPAWRRMAARYRRRLVHVPISRFGAETIEKLRIFHVLNGQHIRSYADHFIRRP